MLRVQRPRHELHIGFHGYVPGLNAQFGQQIGKRRARFDLTGFAIDEDFHAEGAEERCIGQKADFIALPNGWLWPGNPMRSLPTATIELDVSLLWSNGNAA